MYSKIGLAACKHAESVKHPLLKKLVPADKVELLISLGLRLLEAEKKADKFVSLEDILTEDELERCGR